MLFASAWTVTAASATYEDYHNAASALHDGRYEVVEGEVTDFFSGSKRESFSVQGQRFSYSDYIVIAGFHKTTRKGGPIREGLNVRIAYLPASQNMILRLEIAEPR
ncbi:MAG TPA: hypothetical protein VK446_05700 [Methylocystis sp.]|nr:hypothetical protein [Methylocystis sp.]